MSQKDSVQEFESGLQVGRSPKCEKDCQESLTFITSNSKAMAECVEVKIAPLKLDLVAMRNLVSSRISLDSIIFLCGVGINCGNNIHRIVSTMACKETRFKLINLKTILPLQDNTKDNHEAITLSRVMACFPEITINIVHHHNLTLTMIVPYDELKMIHSEFPAIARVQAGASVLPRTLKPEEKHLALALFLVSSLKKSEFLDRTNKEWIETARQEKAKVGFGYMQRYFDSEVLSDEKRNKEALKYGIVTSVGTELVLSAAWRAAGACAVTWLKSNYDFDVAEE